jgi:SET domain-containing protein
VACVALAAKPLICSQTGTKKEYGLRTKQPLKTGEFVVEYVGEVIDEDEFRVRLQEYSVCVCGLGSRSRDRCDAVSTPLLTPTPLIAEV